MLIVQLEKLPEIFLGLSQGKGLVSQAWTELHTEVKRWISYAYECQLCMHLPEANSTTVHDMYCLWAALSVMVRSCHACVNWVVFIPRASHGCCTLPVALHQRDSGLGISHSHARNYLRTFNLHEIFKCAHLKFMVYGRKQTYIHTTSANAVTLVWGLLTLTSTKHLELEV